VNQLFRSGEFTPLNRMIAHAPLPSSARSALARRVDRGIRYIERENETDARRSSGGRAVCGVAVGRAAPRLLLLTGAPGFPALGPACAVPHGHLQWRGEEYLRDVNSALAGYVRAQTAAALIVGAVCVCGFVLLECRTPCRWESPPVSSS